MSTRSLRNRISSRYTSPTTTTDTETPAQPNENPARRNGQLHADEWVEPPVRKMPPSYQDHRGLERLGVLELQEPLGVPPSQKLLQKLKLTFNRPSPRATPMQTEALSTPGAESEKVDFASPVEGEMLSETPQLEDAAPISSPPRGRPAKRDAAEMKQSAYPMEVTPSPVKSSFTSSAQVSPKPHSIQEHLRQDRLQNYVRWAINEAEQRGDLGLVPGLQKLRDSAHSDDQLWNVLDAVVRGSPTDDQLKTFKRFIKRGVKRHLKTQRNTESPYQESPTFNSFSSPTRPSGSLADPFPLLSPSVDSPSRNPPFTSPFRTHPSPPNLRYTQPSQSTRSFSPSRAAHAKMTAAVNHQSPSISTRKRSLSVSSLSSLSSAKSLPEEFAPTIEGDGNSQAVDDSTAAVDDQITTRPGPGNRLRSSGTHPLTAKHASKKSRRAKDDTDYDVEAIAKLRNEFESESFHDYNQIPRPEVNDRHHVLEGEQSLSSTRPESQVPPPVVHPNSLNPSAVLSSPLSAHPNSNPELALTNGTSRKRTYDEIDKDDIDMMTPSSSSPGPLFVPPPPAAVLGTLRAATPRNAKLPATKARKSARVMVSPNKPKNGGITAGISRAGTARDALIGNGADSDGEDNDEYCASCGGEGKLLCCDGCPNSFHHACLEPPLDPEEEVDGEWYCPRCLSRRSKEMPLTSGLLGHVIRRIDDTIPKAFALPPEVRDYFEGVRTGDEGEYEEVGLPRTQNNAVKMNRAGFIDEPNYKDLRDAKGKLITCYQCGLAANGRDIIPCDFCPARWHLDCVDPPLAVPPRRRIGDKPNATWRCPLHTEHDLAGIGRQAEAAPGDLGRIPRLRKPKNAFSIDVTMSRGFRNNGVINVDLMSDEMPEIKEIDMGGGTFRLPEKGIRLDFIDRVKRSWYEDQTFPQQAGRPKKLRDKLYRPDGAVLHHPPHYSVVRTSEPDFFTSAQAIAIAETAKANAALRRKSFREQQTVLSLASLSQRRDLEFSGDHLADLTNQLVSEAPIDVSEAVQRSERGALENLQQLIQKRLALLDRVATMSSRSASRDKSGSHGSPLVNGDAEAEYDDDDDEVNDAGSEMDMSD